MGYKTIAVAGAFTSVLTVSAFAADLPTRKAPPAPIPVALPYNWTGCYVGGNIGGLWADKNFGSINNNYYSENGPNSGDGQNVNGTGVLIGGQVGCNYQVGQWVFGAQADWDWTNTSGSGTQNYGYYYLGTSNAVSTSVGQQSQYYYSLTNHFQVHSLGSATARVGWAFDRFLPYIKGGVAWEMVDYNESLNDNYYSGYGLNQSWGQTLIGWTVGGGFEYAFTDHLTGFAEGDYYDFGSKSINASCNYNSSSICGSSYGYVYSRNVKETDWVGKVGLNWKF